MKSIILTGDWHIRTEDDADRIDKILPKGYPMILMGDLIDAGLNRGMQWNQDNITKQIIYLKKILKNRKVLGYVLGNHEDRIMREIGLNPYQSFLGDPKSEYEIEYIIQKRGSGIRHIVVEHGTRVTQNPLAQLRTLASINPHCDVVALGHDHTLGVWRDRYQWLVRTGSLQEYPDYAKKAILPPKPLGYIKYYIISNKLEIITET